MTPKTPTQHIQRDADRKAKGKAKTQVKGTIKGEVKRKAKGKGNRADQFCIYETSRGNHLVKAAIEYKAPHKLTVDEIVTGLNAEVQPERDVINKEGEGVAFASMTLATAVVTQLFSYMIGKGARYGYVSTGEAFVFLYIPEDDPTVVYSHVCVPNLDVLDDDENRLHRTAVAQVFAFLLQSLRAGAPLQRWYDKAAELNTWAVEYEDILSKIPETDRKGKGKGKEHLGTRYKPQPWHGFKRTPARTRARCLEEALRPHPRENDSGDDVGPPSPTPARVTRSSGPATAPAPSAGAGERGGRRGKAREQGNQTRTVSIQDRPYCTQKCLLGLAHGGSMDQSCPNADSHGTRHIGRKRFLSLLRAQMARDRGAGADATALCLSGSVGTLLKVRLSKYGYTLVAKGVEARGLARLRHERDVYERARSLQGKQVPVCVGLMDLVLPFYHDGRVCEHLLLLSWAGQPLYRCVNGIGKRAAMSQISKAFTSLHQLGILHGDAEARNVVYNERLFIVDFERAKVCSRETLGLTSPNGRVREEKYGRQGPKEMRTGKGTRRDENDAYTKELHLILGSVSRLMASSCSATG